MAEYKICFSVAGAFGAQISFEAKPGISYEAVAASIAEEIADVEIMLEQMKMLFCCADDVRNERRRKVERLKERLDNG